MVNRGLCITLVLLFCVGAVTAMSLPSFPAIRYGEVILVEGESCIADTLLVKDEDGQSVGSGKITSHDSSCLYSVGIDQSTLVPGTVVYLYPTLYYDPVELPLTATDDVASVALGFTRNDVIPTESDNTETEDIMEETDSSTDGSIFPSTEPFVPWHESIEGDGSSVSSQNDDGTQMQTDAETEAGFIPAIENESSYKSSDSSSSSDSKENYEKERSDSDNERTETIQQTEQNQVHDSNSITVLGQSFERIPFFAGIAVFIIFTYVSGMLIAFIVTKQ